MQTWINRVALTLFADRVSVEATVVRQSMWPDDLGALGCGRGWPRVGGSISPPGTMRISITPLLCRIENRETRFARI